MSGDFQAILAGVTITHPHPSTNQTVTQPKLTRGHFSTHLMLTWGNFSAHRESAKHNKYGEAGSIIGAHFVPLVIETYGNMGGNLAFEFFIGQGTTTQTLFSI